MRRRNQTMKMVILTLALVFAYSCGDGGDKFKKKILTVERPGTAGLSSLEDDIKGQVWAKVALIFSQFTDNLTNWNFEVIPELPAGGECESVLVDPNCEGDEFKKCPQLNDEEGTGMFQITLTGECVNIIVHDFLLYIEYHTEQPGDPITIDRREASFDITYNNYEETGIQVKLYAKTDTDGNIIEGWVSEYPDNVETHTAEIGGTLWEPAVTWNEF